MIGGQPDWPVEPQGWWALGHNSGEQIHACCPLSNLRSAVRHTQGHPPGFEKVRLP